MVPKYLLILIFVFSFPLFSLKGEELRRTQKTEAFLIGKDRYCIQSRVEFFSKSHLPSFLIRPWLKWTVSQAEKKLNKNSFFCLAHKKKIYLSFQILWKWRQKGEKPTPGYHQIELIPLWKDVFFYLFYKKSRLIQGFRSWMYLNGRQKGISGAFAFPIPPTTMAHEFGHLFGLHDEYKEKDPYWLKFLKGIQEQPPSIMNLSFWPRAIFKERHYRKIYENIKKYGWKRNKKRF